MALNAMDLAKKCERAGTAIPSAQREAIVAASLNVKEGWTGIAGSAGLMPGKKLRGVGKNGARWGVRYTVRGSYGSPTALVKFTGPVHLVNDATAPHYIVAKGAARARMSAADKRGAQRMSNIMSFGGGVRGGRRLGARGGKGATFGKGAMALTTPQGPRFSAKSPGTKGKHFWPACKAYATRVAPQSFRASLPGALYRSGFGR